MQCSNPSTAPTLGSGSWLVDMILWLDRKSEAPATSPERGKLPVYAPRHPPENTRLYLAYGSNLCSSVFQGNRGIVPVSAVNVVVPELRLCWNLEGIPYAEPCYANAERRSGQGKSIHGALVGVVYEICAADFAHILRTEGQGYAETQVECRPLQPGSRTVTACPGVPSIRACAVLASGAGRRPARNMQPSRRYVDLLVTGAREHCLPSQYIKLLEAVATYEASTPRQRIGKAIFSFLWFAPVVVVILLERRMADHEGRIPHWVKVMVGRCFAGMWWTHDRWFKPVFGDGACDYAIWSSHAGVCRPT
jgi:hypothetical protein